MFPVGNPFHLHRSGLAREPVVACRFEPISGRKGSLEPSSRANISGTPSRWNNGPSLRAAPRRERHIEMQSTEIRMRLAGVEMLAGKVRRDRICNQFSRGRNDRSRTQRNRSYFALTLLFTKSPMRCIASRDSGKPRIWKTCTMPGQISSVTGMPSARAFLATLMLSSRSISCSPV